MNIQWKRLIGLNLTALGLLLSWALPHGLPWNHLDDRIFWTFNQWITPSHKRWDDILALLNTRFFDAASFAVMGGLFVVAMRRDPRPDRLRHWFGIGLTMLLTAAIIAVVTNKAITYGHPSPTRFFAHAARLTDIVSIPTKDVASNSFPGDHGLMLMIFAGFMLRFADRRIAAWSVAFVLVLSAPRIMVGAHWFSDVYMGALSIALLILPWVLCTPVAGGVTAFIERRLARRA
jgi:membrane-associated phospholipid phosphatase